MLQTSNKFSELDSYPSTLRFPRRERKRKRRNSEYYSDDSAVEVDLDAEYSETSKAKRLKKSGASKSLKECVNRSHFDLDFSTEGGEKLLLRQWLLKQADDETIPGLYWYDDAKTQIRIPWKHGSRTGWTLDDCRVYQAWAIHTGKIGCIKEPKKWKANFRCALNSLPDVRELKSLCQKKGSDPYKVYHMLPEIPRKSLAKKTKQCKLEKNEDDEEEFEKFDVIYSCSEGQLFVQMKEIKVKEELNTNPIKTNVENSNWPVSMNMSNKQQEIKIITQFSRSLIPTVVEELSEQTDIEASHLMNLDIVTLPFESQSSSSSSSSSDPLDSVSTSSFSSFLSDGLFPSEGLWGDLEENTMPEISVILQKDVGFWSSAESNDEALFCWNSVE